MGNKIGILTFHRAANFGAVLQAFALQQAISSLDEECIVEIIDYRCKKIEDSYRLFNPNTGNLLKECLRVPFCLKKRWKKRRIFDDFLRDKLHLSAVRYSSDNINDADNCYNAIVSGSDQVWNDILTDSDMTYCLSFVENKNKCFSYAASFGNTSGNQTTENYYKQEIGKFNGISVREKDSVIRLDSLNRSDVVVSPDPTLLLSEDAWGQFASKGLSFGKPYVLIYELTPGKDLVNYAKKIAEERNAELFMLSESFTRFPEIKHLRGINPIDFVSLIRNANCVVTNSFHGTVFSIINNTEFYVETQAQKNTNNRIIHLLKEFKIRGRDISHPKTIDAEICWDQVNLIRRTLAEETKQYLNRIVCIAKGGN